MNTHAFSADLFKWIFALIAGAIIFMFFVRFAYQHIEVTDITNSYETAEQFDDQLEAFGVSEESKKVLSFRQPVDLFLTCDGFGSGSAFKPSLKLFFAPESLEGTSLQLWSQEWKFPYTITPVYYLLNQDHRIYLIYDDTSASFVQQLEIPTFFNILKTHIKNVKIDNIKQETQTLASVHLVYFTSLQQPSSIVSSFSIPAFVTVVHLPTQTLKFFPAGETSFYVDETTLLGALFGPTMYPCVLQKMLDKHHLVTRVYHKKMQYLQAKNLATPCEAKMYESAQTLSLFTTFSDKEPLVTYATKLQDQNAALERNDCAPIY